jgi:hypothetical protein
LEVASEAEMSEHRGCDKHDSVGRNHANSGNGVRSKMVLTEIGPIKQQRVGRAEMSLPDHPITGPNRQRQRTMDHKVEAALNAFTITFPGRIHNKMITKLDQVHVYMIDPLVPPLASRYANWLARRGLRLASVLMLPTRRR